MSEGDAMGTKLSSAGEERRARMLLELQGAMARRRENRRMGRRVGIASLVLVAAAVPALVLRSGSQGPSAGTLPANGGSIAVVAPAETRAPVRVMPTVVVLEKRPLSRVVVTSSVGADVGRFVVVGRSSVLAEEIDDESLLELLGTTGNDYGLLRVGGHVELTCNTCRDAPPPFLSPGARE